MSEQNLYLKVSEDGVPETHAILEDNLKNVIVDFDPLNPPKDIFRFFKTPLPVLKEDEVYDYLEYAYSPELSEQYGQTVWHEVHHVKQLNDSDRDKIISDFKKMNPDLQDWVYDEETKSLIPPVPRPNDGKMYFWNTDEKRWMESNPEMHLEDMIAVAKELGYDLAYGEHGRPPDISETLVDEIIDQIKKQQ